MCDSLQNCFTNWNTKIALLHVSMVVTYYVKLFRTGTDRHNGILMSLLLLVTETIKNIVFSIYSPWFSGPYYPAFGLNTERYWPEYGPEKLRIWTIFTKCKLLKLLERLSAHSEPCQTCKVSEDLCFSHLTRYLRGILGFLKKAFL